MKQTSPGVVVFAEDPGAANCFVPLVQELHVAGIPVILFANGLAGEALRTRGLAPVQLDDTAAACASWSRTRPGWLVVGTSENPDSPAFDLTAAARDAGIPSAALIDSAANAAHRFRGRGTEALRHAPDWLLVPDEWTAREFVRLGHRPDRVVDVGHPHYDFLRAERARLTGIGREALRTRVLPDAGKRFVLVFVSEISTGLDAAQFQRSAQYTLSGRGAASGRTDIVVEELLDTLAALARSGIARPWTVLRLHPKQSPQSLAALVPEFDQVSMGGAPLELLFAADLVVGMTSMALAEAYLLGVATLAVVPRTVERDWLPMLRAGVVECAVNRTDLQRLLGKYLSNDHARMPDAIESSEPSSAVRILNVLGFATSSAKRLPGAGR